MLGALPGFNGRAHDAGNEEAMKLQGRLVSSHMFGPTQAGDDEVGSFGPGSMMPLTPSVRSCLSLPYNCFHLKLTHR